MEHFIEAALELLFGLLTDNGVLVSGICDLHIAIAKRIIKFYFSVCYPEVTLENHHINSIYSICLDGGKVNLPSSVFAEVKNGMLTFYDNEDTESQKFSVVIKETKFVNNLFSNNLIDCDKIVGEICIRTRNVGDKIKLNRRNGTKTLKKLYT